jgi:hypothetical protein
MDKVNPRYNPRRAPEHLHELLCDWYLINKRGGWEDVKINGWELEPEGNSGTFSWTKVVSGKSNFASVAATPWLGGEGVQASLHRDYFDDKQHDDSGESIWRQSYPLPKTGDFEKDWANYLKLMPRILADADRAFVELGSQPFRRWSKEKSDKWDAFLKSLTPGDVVSFKHERPEDSSSGTVDLDVPVMTADDVIDLYNKAKAEPDPEKRAQLMKQVQAASSKLESRKLSPTARQLLGEAPMTGDPDNPRYWQPGYRGVEGQAARTKQTKGEQRNAMQSVFAAEFGEVQPRGQFSLRFEHGGHTWTVRQTSNAIRVIEGPVTFDVSGTSRENAAKVIIAAIKGMSEGA